MAVATPLVCAWPPLLAALSFGATPRAQAADAPPAPVGEASVSEVIVTAEKRAERAQDVPVTVSVLSGDTLANYGAKDLFQIVTLIPGVVFSRAPDDGISLTFRGLGTFTRPAELEQSIGLVEDGVPFAGGGARTSSLGM